MACIMNCQCFTKIVMHCLKYSCDTVNGVLLAKKEKSENQLKFIDNIPMFHFSHGLTPSLEIALLQISAYCKENNLMLAGYYQANRNFHDSTPDVFATKISKKLWDVNNEIVLVMVNNTGIGFGSYSTEPEDSEEPLHLYHMNDGKWKQGPSIEIEDRLGTIDVIRECIYEKKYHLDLIDFDNHLDDIKCDWRNIKINELINKIAKELKSSAS